MRRASHENGFTLVELAIVLLVIGILIVGILKGVELVGNARVVSTITQIKDIESATMIFQTKYRALPGDIENPGEKIVNCTSAQCQETGDEDGYISLSTDPKVATAWSTTGESRNYWLHLSVSGMLGGLNNVYTGTPTKYGVDFLKAPIGGGWQIQSFNEGGRRRTYMMLQSRFVSPSDPDAPQLTPAQAAHIDTKMDDGLANRGVVQSYSPHTEGTCTRTGGSEDDRNTYLQSETETSACVLWVHMTRRM